VQCRKKQNWRCKVQDYLLGLSVVGNRIAVVVNLLVRRKRKKKKYFPIWLKMEPWVL
jgi:hypothetical protein